VIRLKDLSSTCLARYTRQQNDMRVSADGTAVVSLIGSSRLTGGAIAGDDPVIAWRPPRGAAFADWPGSAGLRSAE
jgi:hypothetical protein